MYFKFWWLIRALFYKLFFGKFNFPSYIGKPVMLVGIKKIFIGRNVRIFPQIRMEVHGENASIRIEDNVAIAQNVHITSGSNMVIGKSTTILANVFITNIDHSYQDIGIHILQQEMLINDTEIGGNCYIGMGACIQAGTILGDQCIVGANSVVRGYFPAYSVIVGSPARVVKRFNPLSQVWEKTDSEGVFMKEIVRK